MFLVGSLTLLQGCVTTSVAKYTTDTVCGASTIERVAITAEMDAVTAPNKIRITCAEDIK